jgi:anaphase-promoting complex subunit 3
MKRYGDALREYACALKINNLQIGARFRTIKVLIAQNRFAAALEELKVLKDQAPDESNVHYMLGNVFKKLDQNGDALRHYTVAMNLDPKVSLETTVLCQLLLILYRPLP